jgi:hypothetical protein
MRNRFGRVVLWLFVINLGISFGAGLFESRILVPQWLAGGRWNAEAARQANTGLAFWVYVTTVPLTLLTLANLIAAWKASGALKRWWLSASLAALADRVFTFAYFIPTMLTLMRPASLPDADAAALATQWARLDYVRHAITLAAWLAALKAFALLHRSEG